MNKLINGMAIALLLLGSASAEQPHSFVPKDGFVPDQATAIRVAEAILIPIYGEDKIQAERPFHAVLNRGVWTVTGTMSAEQVGGTALALISKKDGRILRVSHGK